MTTGGFNNPIIGGGGSLVYPSIHSPNFSTVSKTGWSINKNGQATFFSVTLQGGNVVIFGPNGSILIYSGTPAAGNLVIAIAGSAGTDSFGNSWVSGEQIGVAGQGQLIFQPALGQAAVIGGKTGTIQASVSGSTTDTNQAQGSLFGPVLVNPGAHQVMAQIATSPLLATGGMGIVMASAADDASVAAKLSLCSITVSGGTMTFTSIVDVAPNSVTINATVGTAGVFTQVVLTSGTSYTTAANVPATIQCECFGPSGGGGGGGGAPNSPPGGNSGGGGGGGGGEYAEETALAVTPSHMYTIAIGTGGAAGSAGTVGNSGGNGGNGSGATTFAGDSKTVTANAGKGGGGGVVGTSNGNGAGGTAGAGGTGSSNTVHFNGGAGGTGATSTTSGNGGGGAGGGSSAGTGANGNAGGNGGLINGSSSGGGGVAPVGGQAGGNGGTGDVGSGATAGSAGGIPAGAAGGGGGSTNGNNNPGGAGGAGTRGQIKLSYTTVGTPTSYSVPISISSAGNITFKGGDTNQYQTGRLTKWLTGTDLVNSTTPATVTDGTTSLSFPVVIGTYRVHGQVVYLGGQAAGTAGFQWTGPTTSLIWILGHFWDVNVSAQKNWTAFSNLQTSGTLATSGLQMIIIDGIITFTASGTLALQAAEGTATDTFTIQAGAFLDLMPCS